MVRAMWGFLTQKLNSSVAVWEHVCSRPGSPQSACSPGHGAKVDTRGLPSSSAYFSRTVTKVVLCWGTLSTEEQGNAKHVAKVVKVELRGRGTGPGPLHFCKRNQNFFWELLLSA